MSTEYIHFTAAQKEAARQTDLVALLQSQGEYLKRSGKEYVWRDGSEKVTVRGNLWFHQYERIGGDAVDFVRRFYNMDFPQAVNFLLGNNGGALPQAEPVKREPPKPFTLPPKNDNMRRVYAYLLNRRGIDREALSAFVHKGMIYESADYHNAVFVGYDEHGIARHAHKEEQLYREILAVADENGGKLKNRCVFFCDEFGTLPKIESAEMMFSASRSRRLQIVPIIQSFAQLEKNYGKEGAEIIVDNTQDTIFGGFAPNSSSAETLSKALGDRTVMSGSVSRSKNDPSQSLQMIERPLLTPDELKSLPKGDFIVMKTGVHPMRVHLKLFFKWGIEFDDEHPYAVPDQGNREVKYADKKEIQDGILEKYPPEWKEETPAPSDADGGGQAQHDSPKNEPQRTRPKSEKRGGNPIRTSPPKKETAPDMTEAEIIKDLTETEVQSNEPS